MHGSGSPDPTPRPAPPRRFSARRPERFVHRMTASELLAMLDAGQRPPGVGTVQVLRRGGEGFAEGRPLIADRLGVLPLDDAYSDEGLDFGAGFPRLCAPDEGPWDCYAPWEPRFDPCCLELEVRQPRSPSTFSPPPRLAINLVSFELHDAFRIPPLVDDCVELQAGILRQPGLVNLFLPHIYGIHGANAQLRMPWIDAAEFDHRILRDRILDCAAWRHLERLLRALALHGGRQKVLITFIDLGGGSPMVWGSTYRPEGGAPLALPATVTNGDQQDPIFVPWDRSLDGSRFYDDVAATRQSFDVGGDDWRRFTLDPNNAAKRVYFRRLSRALGQALLHLDRRLSRDGIDISQLIEGIEIGNELEVRHTRDGDVDADGWALFYFYCATAIRAECDWVPLFLPALASYARDESKKAGTGATTKACMRWNGKKRFLEGLLERLKRLCDGETALGTDYRLDELVHGVDYHFYHNAVSEDDAKVPSDPAIPLHFLASEVIDLKNRLTSHLPQAQLTVCESGVNVLCSPVEYGSGATCEAEPVAAYRHLISWRPAGVTDPLQFQASSVIMRLSIALAAGAAAAGWHSHIAMPDSFRAMGLHVDPSDPAAAKTSDFSYRPAWWSFRRLAQVVMGATAVRAHSPRIIERGDLRDEEIIDSDMVWIIEIVNATWPEDSGITADSSGLWRAWLLFIEPGGPTRPPPSAWTVKLEAPWERGSGRFPLTSSHRSSLFQLPTVPTRVENLPGAPGAFPLPSWTVPEDKRPLGSLDLRRRRTQWTFTLRPEEPPVLLLTTLSLAPVASTTE